MTLEELLIVRDVIEQMASPKTEEGDKNKRQALHYIYREIRLKTLDPRMGD